ncbi:hypothetical protein PtA15_5A599 [Puccinia triticina]|uniref:CCHC-type domain-containing protein n=1 Tax=Puccinia triticina TaxID=208348 RepID=A0ABY7CMI8_9BASI|nr:uncharacterized protein PtA15_5A599 [Puccinia triticina]WAQ85025.1 hypothetical protein PtA15_5A599 [Puccinia triticina]WAR58360.1 hypothetical protein PtB15_5B594 [Puccinia triticina]
MPHPGPPRVFPRGVPLEPPTIGTPAAQNHTFFYDHERLPDEIHQASQLSQLSTVPEYQYSSQAKQVLGTSTRDKALHPLDIRRCFNCGEPSHTLLGCPAKRNEPLIRLTKQIFQAHNSPAGQEDANRDDGHAQPLDINRSLKDIGSQESIQQALDRRRALASTLRPGKISPPLREAVFWEPFRGLPDENHLDPYRPMPWFQAMEKWGYPPGYAIPLNAQRNPFKMVIARIDESNKDHAWESAEILEMHRGRSPGAEERSDDDEGDEEEVLRLLVPGYEALSKLPVPLPPPAPPIDNAAFAHPALLPPLPNSPPPPSPPPPPPANLPLKRLVKYRGGNFSSDRLPVYNGQMISTQSYLDYHAGHSFSFKDPSSHHSSSVQRSLSNSSGSQTSSTTSSPTSKLPHSPSSTSQDLSAIPNGQRRGKEGASKPTKNPSKIIKQRWKDAALTFAATKAHPNPSPLVILPPETHLHPAPKPTLDLLPTPSSLSAPRKASPSRKAPPSKINRNAHPRPSESSLGSHHAAAGPHMRGRKRKRKLFNEGSGPPIRPSALPNPNHIP